MHPRLPMYRMHMPVRLAWSAMRMSEEKQEVENEHESLV